MLIEDEYEIFCFFGHSHHNNEKKQKSFLKGFFSRLLQVLLDSYRTLCREKSLSAKEAAVEATTFSELCSQMFFAAKAVISDQLRERERERERE